MNKDVSAEDLIRQLGLVRHPEGGWFRETYRSSEAVSGTALPEQFNGGTRSFCTAIYFLLERGDFSALHRIKSDELWFFHAGTTLTIHVLTPEGNHQELKLGSNVAAGEQYQAIVQAGCWFGAEVTGSEGYSLVSCTVSPGFDFEDFEMGGRDDLLKQFHGYAPVIERLTC